MLLNIFIINYVSLYFFSNSKVYFNMDAVINDVIKVGSMSVVSQILGGKSLGDRA